MNMKCVRDCFVRDRLFRQDEAYELPDGFPADEKNFRIIDDEKSEGPAGEGREEKAEPEKGTGISSSDVLYPEIMYMKPVNPDKPAAGRPKEAGKKKK